MKFTELSLHPDVQRGIDEAGFVDCTSVQEKTLEKTLAKTDVYVQSQTGTGKTAAFLITIFHLFMTETFRNKRALILVPTRELAVQVEKEARLLGKHCHIKCGSFFGGMGYDKQEKLLEGELNLFIGTPGRLIDFQKSGKIDFSKFDVLVIDEADRMFDMGFIPDVRYMVKKMVSPKERLTMLYSATLSQRVKQLAWEYMNEPFEIAIEPEHITVETITQELYHISREEKFSLLLGILKKENPKSLLIFTNTKKMAEIISRRLRGNGYENEYISGDLPQKKRLKIIDSIKAGKTSLLVATDVAARGLHIEALDLVINYDLPDDFENYVHRIGRTARAGKAGKAISLACEQFVFNLEAIEKFIGMKIPTVWHTEDMLLPDKSRERAQQRHAGHERPAAHERQAPAESTAGEPAREKRKRPRRKKKGGTDTGDQAARPARPVQPVQAQRPSNPERPSAAERPARAERPEQQHQARPRPAGQPKQQTRREGRDRSRRGKRFDSSKKQGIAPLKKDASYEERIEYYRKKYGDDFMRTDTEKKKPEKTVSGVLKKIISLFKITK